MKLQLRLSPFVFVLIAVSTAIPVFSQTSARSFDWQYNRIGAPFAVFYNPSLISSNPGSTLGFDMRSDSASYDIRGAIVIPVSKVALRETLIRDNSGRFLNYANQSYRSSKSALSVGGIYNDPEEYQLSLGFAAPVYLIQSGMSFDLVYRNELQFGAVNLAFGLDVSNFLPGNVLYFGVGNLLVSDRTTMNDLKVSIGAAGTLSSSGPLFFTPYDLIFAAHFRDGGVNLMEGTARVNLDLSSLRTSGSVYGQMPAAALGYTLVRGRGGESYNHRIFANFGITFINKSSSAAILGSYGHRNGRENEKNAAFFYSAFRRSDAEWADSGMTAALGYKNTDDGKVLFSLNTAGPTASSWVLRIEKPNGNAIRTFSGGNAVPSSVLWDGLMGDGSVVEEELIFVKLVLLGGTKTVESNVLEIPFKQI